MFIKLLKKLRARGAEKVKKKLKKKLRRKLRRFFGKLLLLALLACTGYMAFVHRKLIASKLLHREAPKGECPRPRLLKKKA